MPVAVDQLWQVVACARMPTDSREQVFLNGSDSYVNCVGKSLC